MRVEEKLDALRNDLARLTEALAGHEKILGTANPKFDRSRPTLPVLNDMLTEQAETLSEVQRDLADLRRKTGFAASRPRGA
jgi:uncharacterized coiled-coil protein SlyX